MTSTEQHRPTKRDGTSAPVGDFEAISRKPTGDLHRTRHHSAAAANRRLAGNMGHNHHRQ